MVPHPRRGCAGAYRRATRAQVAATSASKHAPHTCANFSACFFAATIRYAGPAFAAPCPAARPGPCLTGQTAFGVGRRVVSQLLAGPRNGPGGSPTPPRVTCMRRKPRGDTAPRPAHDASRNAPSEGRGGAMIRAIGRAGISSPQQHGPPRRLIGVFVGEPRQLRQTRRRALTGQVTDHNGVP